MSLATPAVTSVFLPRSTLVTCDSLAPPALAPLLAGGVDVAVLRVSTGTSSSFTLDAQPEIRATAAAATSEVLNRSIGECSLVGIWLSAASTEVIGNKGPMRARAHPPGWRRAAP